MTTLPEFYSMLANHDWYFEYSDDHKVWSRGRASRDRIFQVSKETPEHSKLYEEYFNYAFREGTQPERPENK